MSIKRKRGRRKEERFGREGGKERERKEPHLTDTPQLLYNKQF